MKRTVTVTTFVVIAFGLSLAIGLNELPREAAAYVQPVTNSALLATTTPQMNTSRPHIAGMSIACSDDHVYTWYEDGKVTSGTSSNLAAYQPSHDYYRAADKTVVSPNHIVGMGIAGNDHVYTWYQDGHVSSGTSTILSHYGAGSYKYSLPPGKTPADVVGIDIACSDDHVYAWYKDGTASSGTSDDLDKYRGAYPYSLPPGKTPADVVEIGIAGNDHVYAWYWDGTVSSGTSSDLDQYRALYSYNLGLACDLKTYGPATNDTLRSLSGSAIRGPSCETSEDVVVRLKRYQKGGFLETLAENRGRGTNFVVSVGIACPTNPYLGTTFVEVESQGRKVRSVERNFFCKAL